MYRFHLRLCAYRIIIIFSVLACCTIILKQALFLSSIYSSIKTSVFDNRLSHNITRLICHDFDGRLGNQLFQYASILGLAYRADKMAIFLGNNQLDTVLKVPPLSPSIRDGVDTRCSNAKSLHNWMSYRFDEKLTRLDPEMDYKINGYLQSWKYFDQFEERIREAVRFSDDVNERAARVVKDIRDMHNYSQLVGVHVRRGDFLLPDSKKHGYPLAGPEYFQRSFDFFQTRFLNVTFIIVSEAMIWCKKYMPQNYTVQFLRLHEPEVDMAILALLDHVIITFGTFSWWAGFLNPGMTVHVKDFIRVGTPIGIQLAPNGTDYIHPGWILL